MFIKLARENIRKYITAKNMLCNILSDEEDLSTVTLETKPAYYALL
jgi:hypothetical protein